MGKLIKNPLVSVIFIYFALVVLINPLGEFAVNDDWIFTRQIEAFLTGRIRISQLIDPSFIAQGMMGYGWAKVFGYSFTSLRIFTILLTPLFLLGFSKLLDHFNVRPKLKFLILLTVIFNPLVFTSSMSFMTEIYFLLFFIWALFFYVRSFNKKYNTYISIILGSVFTGISILVRHVGVSLFIAYVIALFFHKGKIVKPNKEVFIKVILSAVPIALSIIIYFMWPRYSLSIEGLSDNPAAANIQKVLIQPKYLWKRASMLFYSLIYFVFFLSPLIIALPARVRKEYKVLLVVFISILAFRIYNLDIFPVGNVFYVEKLYGKSGFKTNFSLFDNVPFKIFLSFYISYLVSKILIFSTYLLKKSKSLVKSKKTSSTYLLLLFSTAGFFSLNILGNDFYDRYLLPSVFTFLFILLLSLPKTSKLNLKLSLYAAILMAFMSVALQVDFIHRTKMQWNQGRKLMEETGRVKSIYINDLFSKHMNAEEKGDYTGLIGLLPGSSYVCFVQVYSTEETKLVKILQSINNRLRRYQKNPKIYGSKTVYEPPRISSKLDKLKHNEEYISPIYNLVGKKSFVGAWCDLDDES